MKVIAKKRGTGKTLDLIRAALDSDSPILVKDKPSGDRIVQKSISAFKRVCKVITAEELSLQYSDKAIPVLVDDAEHWLQEYLKLMTNSKVKVEAITVTLND